MKKVLVTDDDASLRQLLAVTLKRAGYEVETAENGKESLERLDQQPFDAVLLDLMMPVMSGFEVLDELNRRQQKVCVIVISAVPEVYLDRVKSQVVGVIPKPFDLSELTNTLDVCIDRFARGEN